jgi:ABC-2 type transport system ATP-binding protein
MSLVPLQPRHITRFDWKEEAMTNPSSPAITAVDVRKSFGDNVVLDGLDLTVEQGSVFALLGPNGAGKTTMVRILATLLDADHGTISALGRERIGQLLERFELTDAADRIVMTYSGGMRRRLDLAMTLIGSPQVIFLDEPSTGLDPSSRRTVWEIVRSLADDGTTVFLTTQYLEEADRLADRVAILDRGRLVAEGSAQELKQRIPGGRIDVRFADADAQLVAADALGMPVFDQHSPSLQIPTDGNVATLRRVLRDLDEADVDVVDLAIHTPDLDDVFFALTGRGADPQEMRTEEELYR